MINVDENFEENFNFDDFDEEQSVNTILNNQHDNNFGLIKNLLVILLIIAVGIAVFWGSFLLGKKVFSSSLSDSTAPQKDLILDEELADFAIPDDKIIYEIEKIEEQKEVIEQIEKKQPKPEAKNIIVKKIEVPVVKKEEDQKEIISKPTKPIKKIVKTKKTLFKVIAGSYSNLDNAQSLKKKLSGKGFGVYIATIEINKKTMYRVQIGAFDKMSQAKMMIKKVRATGYDAFYIQE
jgi:hypothetical protein